MTKIAAFFENVAATVVKVEQPDSDCGFRREGRGNRDCDRGDRHYEWSNLRYEWGNLHYGCGFRREGCSAINEGWSKRNDVCDILREGRDDRDYDLSNLDEDRDFSDDLSREIS